MWFVLCNIRSSFSFLLIYINERTDTTRIDQNGHLIGTSLFSASLVLLFVFIGTVFGKSVTRILVSSFRSSSRRLYPWLTDSDMSAFPYRKKSTTSRGIIERIKHYSSVSPCCACSIYSKQKCILTASFLVVPFWLHPAKTIDHIVFARFYGHPSWHFILITGCQVHLHNK